MLWYRFILGRAFFKIEKNLSIGLINRINFPTLYPWLRIIFFPVPLCFFSVFFLFLIVNLTLSKLWYRFILGRALSKIEKNLSTGLINTINFPTLYPLVENNFFFHFHSVIFFFFFLFLIVNLTLSKLWYSFIPGMGWGHFLENKKYLQWCTLQLNFSFSQNILDWSWKGVNKREQNTFKSEDNQIVSQL